MATLYGTEITGIDNRPTDMVDPTRWNGKVHCYMFTWTGDAAQNDFVEVLRLPPGVRVLQGRVDFTDLGTSVTMDIGTAASENRYLSAQDVATAAGQADFANTLARNGLGSDLLTAETSIFLKFEAADPVSGTVAGYLLVSAI